MAASAHGDDFGFALRDVNEDPRAGAFGSPRAFLQERVGAGVERVRGNAGRNTRGWIGAEAFEQSVGHLPGRRRAGVGDGLSDNGADAGLGDHRRDAVHVAQPVGDAGDTVQQELRASRPYRGDIILDGECSWPGTA
jgi:hypothetical protein